MAGPLSSLKVLDFSTLLPGPFATMFLADLGADVLRIEAPNRPDIVRMQPPFIGASDISASHATFNRSKRSICLNLKHPTGVEIVKKLVKHYDIVLEQFRPGVMERLGVGYEALHAENPQLIYCSLTGYGQNGPLAPRAGHDMTYMALSGQMSFSGAKATGPTPQATQVADIGGGSFCALTGILSAVIHRYHTGEGQMIDVSMLDGAIALNAAAGAEYLAGGDLPDYEMQLLNGGSQYNYYRTADQRYLAISPLEPQFWQGFCTAIQRPDLVDKLTTVGLAMHPIRDEIAQTIATRSLADWLSIFAPLDLCVEPVLTLEEMATHPHTQARSMIVEVDGIAGSVHQIANPIKFSKTAPEYSFYGVPAGFHNTEVLSELGFTSAEIQDLLNTGVLG